MNPLLKAGIGPTLDYSTVLHVGRSFRCLVQAQGEDRKEANQLGSMKLKRKALRGSKRKKVLRAQTSSSCY